MNESDEERLAQLKAFVDKLGPAEDWRIANITVGGTEVVALKLGNLVLCMKDEETANHMMSLLFVGASAVETLTQEEATERKPSFVN